MDPANSPPSEVAKIAEGLSNVFCQATQLAAVAAAEEGRKARGLQGPDHISGLYAACVGTLGGLHIVASMLGHHGDKNREGVEHDDIGRLINPTSTLLAAVLMHNMAPSAVLESTTAQGAQVGAHIVFSPSVLLDSIQEVERITGRPVDGWVKPSLLKHVRAIAENSDEPMNRFLAQRRETPGNLH